MFFEFISAVALFVLPREAHFRANKRNNAQSDRGDEAIMHACVTRASCQLVKFLKSASAPTEKINPGDIAYFMKRPPHRKQRFSAAGKRVRSFSRTLSQVVMAPRKSNCGIAHSPFAAAAADGINDLEGNYNDKSAKSVATHAPPFLFSNGSQRAFLHDCLFATTRAASPRSRPKTVIG